MNPVPPDKAERFLRHIEPLRSLLEAYCHRSLSDRSEAADALQSAVASAYADFDLYAEGTNFRAWIFRYLSYQVLNRNRATALRREREQPATETVEAPSLPVEAASIDKLLEAPEFILEQCDDALSEAILALPDLQRHIFLLRAVGEFKYREIAEILEVPIGTVMGLLARGRERLRHNLADYAETHGLLSRRTDDV